MGYEQFQFTMLMMCCVYCVHLSATLVEKGISDGRVALPCAFVLALLKWWRQG